MLAGTAAGCTHDKASAATPVLSSAAVIDPATALTDSVKGTLDPQAT